MTELTNNEITLINSYIVNDNYKEIIDFVNFNDYNNRNIYSNVYKLINKSDKFNNSIFNDDMEKSTFITKILLFFIDNNNEKLFEKVLDNIDQNQIDENHDFIIYHIIEKFNNYDIFVKYFSLCTDKINLISTLITLTIKYDKYEMYNYLIDFINNNQLEDPVGLVTTSEYVIYYVFFDKIQLIDDNFMKKYNLDKDDVVKYMHEKIDKILDNSEYIDISNIIDIFYDGYKLEELLNCEDLNSTTKINLLIYSLNNNHNIDLNDHEDNIIEYILFSYHKFDELLKYNEFKNIITQTSFLKKIIYEFLNDDVYYDLYDEDNIMDSNDNLIKFCLSQNNDLNNLHYLIDDDN